MKTFGWQLVGSLLLAGNLSAWGQTLPGTLSTDYLAPADWLSRVTVGADGGVIGRAVSPDTGDDVELDVATYGGFLGYDLTPAITAYLTVGGTDDNTFDAADNEDSGSGGSWSVGASLNLAAYDIRQPALLVGDRLTIRLQPEIASVDADSAEWTQYSVSLPIAYEIIEVDQFEERAAKDKFVFAIYVGPVFSTLDGEFNAGPADGEDFESTEDFGVLGGVDLYLTRYFSLGGHVTVFDTDDDQVTGGGSVRYHF